MSEASMPFVAGQADHGDAELRRGVMKVRHLVVFVVGAAAPLTILIGFAPLGLSVAGAALPVAYLIPGMVYMLFAVGFTAMSRHFHGSGAFYAYIAEGLSSIAGAGAAMLAYLGYLGGQVGFVLACGIFSSAAIATLLGVTPSVYLCAIVVAILVALIGYFKVDVGAKVLAVLMALELGCLAVFCVAVLFRGGYEGLGFDGITMSTVFSAGLVGALLITFTAFIGFEQTAIYSDECDNPRKTVSRATFIALGILTFVYTFCAWVIVQAVGVSRMTEMLSGDPSQMVLSLNSEFVGTAMTDVLQLLIVTSFFAGCLALHNACTRYLFNMGRNGLLPHRLGRVSPMTRTPSVAGLVQSGLVVGVIAIFALTPADPYSQVVVWTNTPTIIAVLLLQILTSIAVVRYFRRDARGESLWTRVIAPMMATLVLAAVVVNLALNMGQLTGLGPLGNLVINIPLVVGFVVGVMRALVQRRHTVRLVGSVNP